MDIKQRFQDIYPTAFFLEKEVSVVEHYLQQQGWIVATEKVLHLEKPGEGNMNFVLRVRTTSRSFILKQARPWVEKFPQIDAPVDRVGVEATFFQTLQDVPIINAFMPKCLGYDAANFLLAVEDLGAGADYSFLYKGATLTTKEAEQLAQYLSILHGLPTPVNFPANTAMRTLNHEHIFNFPYLEENGLNLDDIQNGLQAVAMPYKTNLALKEQIKTLGAVYLSQGKHLLHGDFYPGSWLKNKQGLKVIDPEFGFVGPAEFDLGVLLAHLVLSEQSPTVFQTILDHYQSSPFFKESLLVRFVGIEILRRLIGIAQLPLEMSLSTKKILLKRASNWVLSGEMS